MSTIRSGGRMTIETPSSTIKLLIIVNVVVYVLELLLLRLGFDGVIDALVLNPKDVLTRGWIWQLFTSLFLHAPSDPSHLLFNMLFLWWFGSPLERMWGRSKFLVAYIASGLGGAVLTVVVGGIAHALVPTTGFGIAAWSAVHVGASGCTMGIFLAWGAVHWNQTLNFFLIGPLRARTFVLFMVGFEVLRALSFSAVSSTSHFGGMAVGWLIGREILDVDRVTMGWLRVKRAWKRRQLEASRPARDPRRDRFKVIDGGRTEQGGQVIVPGAWGRKAEDDDDDPMVH